MTQLLPETIELVMVDAAGGFDWQRHRVYLCITPTAAGDMPIGEIVTDSEHDKVFVKALQGLMDCFPQKALFGHGTPQIFLKNNNTKGSDLKLSDTLMF